MIRIEIPGPPRGKGRPRFVRTTGRTYTPDETVSAEQAIRQAWMVGGSKRLEGPLALNLLLYYERPATHYRMSGELSAEGHRYPHPTRKPDVDNALKLFMDALNGHAYKDDAQVVQVDVRKVWSIPHRTIALLEPLNGETP